MLEATAWKGGGGGGISVAKFYVGGRDIGVNDDAPTFVLLLFILQLFITIIEKFHFVELN